MKRILLTKGQFALVDDDDFEWLNQWKWHALTFTHTPHCRAARGQQINGRNQIILMHRQIMGFPKMEIDHRNLNPLDNRKANLRLSTSSQNKCNKPLGSTNSSGFKGVHLHKDKNRWMAYITLNYKRRYLGYFDSAIEAALAYDKASLELHGEFGRTNF